VLFNCKQRLSSGLHPGTFVTTDGGETWSTYPYYSVAKMGIMPQDTTLWVIDLGDLCSSSAPETVDGYLYRTHPYVGEAYPRGRLMYPGRVRWVANAGEKVYVLTTDGRLIMFDDLVVSVRADPENSHPALIVHSIYPNPAENHVNILYSAAPLETVTIYLHDMLGRMVMKNELGETDGVERNNRTIDVGYLSAGIYRLTIFTKSSRASSLLVKH
jgi:hypothetical protein